MRLKHEWYVTRNGQRFQGHVKVTDNVNGETLTLDFKIVDTYVQAEHAARALVQAYNIHIGRY